MFRRICPRKEFANAIIPKTLDQALDVIDHLVTSVEVDLSGLAISVPGTVDTEEGVIYYGGLLRFFHGFRVKETLQAKYHLPVVIRLMMVAAATWQN